MTPEMLRLILSLALQHLSRLSPAVLAEDVPWLTLEHVHWCEDNLHHLVWEDAEYVRAKQCIMEAATQLKKDALLSP